MIRRFVRTAAVMVMAGFLAIPLHAQLAGLPGAFSRMGFGARGMALGNAMVAVSSGDVTSYYNPSILPGATERVGSASMGFLSLDRSLNFLSYAQPLPPMAGISLGLINAGVSRIDGRDSDGQPTGDLRTSENQAFLGFAARFAPGFSIGVNLKLYYYQLYTDVSSTTVGIDIGALWPVDESLTLGAAVRDINSRYKWDTGKLFGQSGQTSEEHFPRLYVAGAALQLPDSIGLLTGEVELSSESTVIARFGAEYRLIPEFTLRAGIDRIDMKGDGNGIRPAFGFTARKGFGNWVPAVSYAYVLEPFSPSAIHMVTLSVTF